MKRFLSFVLFFSAPAALAATLKIGSEKAELRLVGPPKPEVQLDVLMKGKLRQSFPHLGTSVGNITYKDQESTLLVADFDNDGYDEFLVRTAQPPLVGALWVFQYDKKEKLYAHVLNDHGDRNIPVPLDGAVRIETNGDLTFSVPGGERKRYRWTAEGYRPAK